MIFKMAVAPLLLFAFYVSIVFVVSAFRPEYPVNVLQIAKLLIASVSWAFFCFLVDIIKDKEK